MIVRARSKRILYVAVGVGATAWLVLAIYFLPILLVRKTHSIQEADVLNARNDVRGQLLQVSAAVVLGAGLYFTGRTYWLTREGQITERFTKAVDQLDKDKGLHVRLGGIYALERIARDSPHDRRAIFQPMIAYVHEGSPWRTHQSRTRVPTDVQAAVVVLGRVVDLIQRSEEDAFRYGETIDLRDLDLRGGAFDLAKFSGADLRGTHFDGASLFKSDFSYTQLHRTSFHAAQYMDKAILRNASYFATTWPDGFHPEETEADESMDEVALVADQKRRKVT